MSAIGEVLDRIEAAQAIDDVEDAHAFLKAVYRNPAVPLSVRMRAAIEALPFERPQLRATALITSDDLATRLDRALARSGATPEIIEASAKTIEAAPIADARPRAPSVPDRRFRRA